MDWTGGDYIRRNGGRGIRRDWESNGIWEGKTEVNVSHYCKNSDGDEKKIEIMDINRGQHHHPDREIRVNNLFILP